MSRPRARPFLRRFAPAFAALVLGTTFGTEASAQCAPSAPVLTNPRITYAVAGLPLVLRVHVEACAIYSAPTTTLTGNVLEVGISSDRVFIGCQPERDQDFSLPAVPAGNYVLNFIAYPAVIGSCPSFEQ